MNLKQVLIARLGLLEIFSLLWQRLLQQDYPAPPIPNSLLPDHLVNQLLPAYQLLHRVAEVQPGERLLVHDAASPLGLALLQLGRQAGLALYGTASAAKHELLNDMQTVGIDSRREDFLAAVRTLSGDGMDIVVHPLDLPSLLRSYRALRSGGRLVLYLSGGLPHPSAYLLAGQLWALLLNLWPGRRRVLLYDPAAFQGRHPNWFRKDLSLLADWLEEGRIF